MRRPTHLRILLITLPFLLAFPVMAGQGERLPYRLGVEVVNYDRSVRESFRESVELDLVQRLDRSACFESVGRATEADSQADLLLRVVLGDLEDETRYQISQAARDAPDALPDTSRMLDVIFKVNLEMQMLKLPGASPFRVRRIHVRESYRPILNEDPHDEAEYKTIASTVEAARRFACKGSAGKMAKEIRRISPTSDAPSR